MSKHQLCQKCCHHPRKNPGPRDCNCPFPGLSQTLPDVSSTLSLDSHTNDPVAHGLLCVPPSTRRRVSRLPHVVACLGVVCVSFSYGWSVSQCMDRRTRYVAIHLSMDIWEVSTFWQWWIILLWTFMRKFLYEHVFSSLRNIPAWVRGALSYKNLYLTFRGIGRRSTMATPCVFSPAAREGPTFSSPRQCLFLPIVLL